MSFPFVFILLVFLGGCTMVSQMIRGNDVSPSGFTTPAPRAPNSLSVSETVAPTEEEDKTVPTIPAL